MNVWTVKRIALVAGLSTVAVLAASAVDAQGTPSAPTVAAGSAAAARVTTSSTPLVARPAIHATENGKCVASSPDC